MGHAVSHGSNGPDGGTAVLLSGKRTGAQENKFLVSETVLLAESAPAGAAELPNISMLASDGKTGRAGPPKVRGNTWPSWAKW
jgi:hypothetical protein